MRNPNYVLDRGGAAPERDVGVLGPATEKSTWK
jgi:hypothetical protein